MNAPTLQRLIYSSTASAGVSSRDVEDILESARRNNAAKQVTGALLFCDGRFVQILEGAPDTLDQLLEVIRQDERHHEVDVHCRSGIAARSFSDWSMAYLGEQTDFSDIAGLNSVSEVIEKIKTGDSFVATFVLGCQAHLPDA